MKRSFVFLFGVFLFSVFFMISGVGMVEDASSAVCTCVGDSDGDQDVDGLDLTWFAQAYADLDLDADLNNDGYVNQDDVEIFASEFGRTDC